MNSSTLTIVLVVSIAGVCAIILVAAFAFWIRSRRRRARSSNVECESTTTSKRWWKKNSSQLTITPLPPPSLSYSGDSTTSPSTSSPSTVDRPPTIVLGSDWPLSEKSSTSLLRDVRAHGFLSNDTIMEEAEREDDTRTISTNPAQAGSTRSSFYFSFNPAKFMRRAVSTRSVASNVDTLPDYTSRRSLSVAATSRRTSAMTGMLPSPALPEYPPDLAIRAVQLRIALQEAASQRNSVAPSPPDYTIGPSS